MDAAVLLDAGAVSRCRRRVHLEHDPSAADAPRAAADPTAEQRSAHAAARRRAVARALSGLLGGDFAEVPTHLPLDGRLQWTTALVQRRVPFIWNAQLPADSLGGRRGSVDLLVRSGRGYLPLIVVRHKVTDPGAGARTGPLSHPTPAAAQSDPSRKLRPQPRDQLRLAHALRLLEAAGLCAPGARSGGVIGQEAEFVVWHDLVAPIWPGGRSALDEYDSRFADRLAIARTAAGGGEPLAVPTRINECRSCPWWPTCGAALHAVRDVSLVVRGQDAVVLRDAGVRTVDDLAALHPADDPAIQLAGPLADAVVLARAWQRDLPLVRRHAEVPVHRADVEVDVDMESYGESGAYLWGCLLSGDVGTDAGYHAFATWDPLPSPDEARSFAEFWTWLTGMRASAEAQGRSFAAYCYNEQAENRWMLSSARRFAGRPGVPTVEAVRTFIASPQWIDLYATIDNTFLCAHGKGLKTVAPIAGFTWQDPHAGGENSMRWYRDAVGLDSGVPDAAQRERLLTYNADDVRATYALRSWLDSAAVTEVPLAADLTPLPGC